MMALDRVDGVRHGGGRRLAVALHRGRGARQLAGQGAHLVRHRRREQQGLAHRRELPITFRMSGRKPMSSMRSASSRTSTSRWRAVDRPVPSGRADVRGRRRRCRRRERAPLREHRHAAVNGGAAQPGLSRQPAKPGGSAPPARAWARGSGARRRPRGPASKRCKIGQHECGRFSCSGLRHADQIAAFERQRHGGSWIGVGVTQPAVRTASSRRASSGQVSTWTRMLLWLGSVSPAVRGGEQ